MRIAAGYALSFVMGGLVTFTVMNGQVPLGDQSVQDQGTVAASSPVSDSVADGRAPVQPLLTAHVPERVSTVTTGRQLSARIEESPEVLMPVDGAYVEGAQAAAHHSGEFLAADTPLRVESVNDQAVSHVGVFMAADAGVGSDQVSTTQAAVFSDGSVSEMWLDASSARNDYSAPDAGTHVGTFISVQ